MRSSHEHEAPCKFAVLMSAEPKYCFVMCQHVFCAGSMLHRLLKSEFRQQQEASEVTIWLGSSRDSMHWADFGGLAGVMGYYYHDHPQQLLCCDLGQRYGGTTIPCCRLLLSAAVTSG